MEFKHQLDEWPPFIDLLLLGLQWFAISIPGIIIVVKVVGALYLDAPAHQVVYFQKLSLVVSLSLFAQIMWGHRLPLILGPSTVLLIGVIASSRFDQHAVYSSIMVGGLALSMLSLSGFFGYVQKLFTPRVVAVVLILIAFTLMPTVLNLITAPHRSVSSLANLIFAVLLISGMFLFNRLLGAIWGSTMILWAMLVGSVVYYCIFARAFHVETQLNVWLAAPFFADLAPRWSFEPGVLVSFLFCFFALSINDLGSIQSMKQILGPPGMLSRINRGITLTGFANVLAGLLGVVGPVNFSLSPGVIAATRSASRFTLVPAAILMFLLSFSPFLISLLGNIPPAVIGSSLAYILCYQVVAGKNAIFHSRKDFSRQNCLIIGFPVLAGTIIAFLPATITHSLPVVLRPIIGNGFVMGVMVALVLEHLILKSYQIKN